MSDDGIEDLIFDCVAESDKPKVISLAVLNKFRNEPGRPVYIAGQVLVQEVLLGAINRMLAAGYISCCSHKDGVEIWLTRKGGRIQMGSPREHWPY